MKISRSIFRDYDIRGIYPAELNEEISEVIGKALGSYIQERNGSKIVVARDNRPSSLFITESFIKGILSTGIDVTHVGITLTPVIHFLMCSSEFDAGVVVTASHNPKDFNGFRIDLPGAVPFYGSALQKLIPIIEHKAFRQGEGEYCEKNLASAYVSYIVERFKFTRTLKVVFDCGNGASSEIVPELFGKLNLDIIPTFCSFDSDFPHGVPDPENPLFLKTLAAAVLENKADVGIGFDTDGDRFGVVDDKGQSYGTDQMLMFFAADILRDNHGKSVYYDVKSTGALEKFIKDRGGVPHMMQTGHPYFAEAKDNMIVAAEFSGHTYFRDKYYGYDDGIYAACRVLDILDRDGRKMSDIMKMLPKRVNTPELKVPCSDSEKFTIVAGIKARIEKEHDFTKVVDIDGVRANISDSAWFLIRASNTSPYLSIRMEGASDRELEVLRNRVSVLLNEYNLKLD